MTWRIEVAVQAPAHSALGDTLTYASAVPIEPGTLVRIPLGKRETLGIAMAASAFDESAPATVHALKPISGVLDGLPPLSDAWRDLVAFAARYYQRALGEVALAALPPQLRDLTTTQLARRLKRLAATATATAAHLTKASAIASTTAVEVEVEVAVEVEVEVVDVEAGSTTAAAAPPTAAEIHVLDTSDRPDTVALSAEQVEVLAHFATEPGPFLLYGATGSGKTEVYLRAVAALLADDPSAQALVMVPEINLTPQLESRFAARFGSSAVVSLHSGMTNPQRLNAWLAAHAGAARIVLGTRMAVFASMPRLRLIVVDEEHDPSYKQQEGARYSARDLALWRGRREGAKVLLGSATPSLESWHHSRPADGEALAGRYARLLMPSRIGAGVLPTVRLVDMNLQPPRTLMSTGLLAAIGQRIERGEQSMVFLNRRGYAPVLACDNCDWKSECPHCSAYRVFHKIDRTLRCHHCGFTERVPRACPACGNPDIAPVGRGTERLEEQLTELFADVRRPDGGAVRLLRIDADSTRRQGALEQQLAQVHGGEIDLLVGTQMIAKGHDFRRITLVAAINPDGALFSSDYRAPERLFSLLMQSSGRAGRDGDYVAAQGGTAEMWVQTHHPKHPLFAALRSHDYPAFAAQQLAERRAAGMPPFAFQALLRADARTQAAAQSFLQAASTAAQQLDDAPRVSCYPPVPLAIQRVADVERAQMLIESASRAALQRFLAAWQPALHALRRTPEGKGVIRWLVDVDPHQI